MALPRGSRRPTTFNKELPLCKSTDSLYKKLYAILFQVFTQELAPE